MVSFYIGREEIMAKRSNGFFSRLNVQLFSLLSKNATRPTAYFNLPSNRVVELGNRVEI